MSGSDTDTGSAEPPLGARLAQLDELAGQPLPIHVDVYDALHAELQLALSEIDGA